jgi:hypothetical protein
VHGVFRAWENEWYQFQQGLFSDDEFIPRRERWRRNMTEDALFRDSWLDTRGTFSPGFRAEIDIFVASEGAEDID